MTTDGQLPLSVNTLIPNEDDEAKVNIVTPPNQGALETRLDESGFVSDDHELESVEEALEARQQSLAILKDIPMQFYSVVPWELVATIWSRNVSSDQMAAACQSAVPEFFDKYSKKTLDERSKELFLKHCNSCLAWPQLDNARPNDVFCEFLKTTFVAQPLFSSVFASHKPPETTNWGIETELFLPALISHGTRNRSGAVVVGNHIAGCSRKPLEGPRLSAVCLIEKTIKEGKCNPRAIIEEDEPTLVFDSQLQMEAALQQSCQRRKIMLKEMREQVALDREDRDPEFRRISQMLIIRVLTEEVNETGVSTICVGEGKGQHKVDYVRLPRRRKAFSELTPKRKRQIARLLKAIVIQLVGSAIEEQEELLLIFIRGCFATLVLLCGVASLYSIEESQHCEIGSNAV
ncbi:unnamed protein product [Cylindrotheca closterium]|uniref:Uncharacterized protein n=1 Tax=Cylindrotheca closterium TaxID=2856 RepID=A0AAD2CZ13_9STRA|nr:unnamed protein product [Cylindrotheca closterium]